ncbi:MAG: diphthine synthase [Candidatus Micrarchaeota archaeon]
MIILIGAGVSNDLTLRAIEEMKNCDVVYAEVYTDPMLKEALPAIERLIGKRIIELPREKVESEFLVNEAVDKTVALIAGGDALIATTHVVLVIECKKKNIPIRVIHNSSIYSVAPAKAGLQMYRFGKTASLVNPRPNYKPTSSLDIIRENLQRNLHTLVLCDTEPEPMTAAAALKQLAEFEYAVVLSRLGEKGEQIIFGKVAQLIEDVKYLGEPPFTIIIPAKLHIVEEEYLEWCKL